MTDLPWTLADLLPHTGAAILLDAVLACGERGLSACVTIRPDSPFRQDTGIPAHVGIEYMAQACAAFSGIQARRNGAAPSIGFLLGTRRYAATEAWFAVGARLVVNVELVYRDDEIGMFDCAIVGDDRVLATAQVVVAEPRDVAALLAREDRLGDG